MSLLLITLVTVWPQIGPFGDVTTGIQECERLEDTDCEAIEPLPFLTDPQIEEKGEDDGE